jgi:phospholipase C
MPVTKPQLTVFGPSNNATVNLNQPFPVTGQVTNPFVSGEPVTITSVAVRVDGGPVIEANLTVVPDRTQTRVNFAASAQVTVGPDPHKVTVTAINDQEASATQTVSVLTAPVVVPPPPPPPSTYTVQHFYVGSLEDVTVLHQHETVRVKYSLSRDFSIRHPGSLHRFLYAEYLFHPKADSTERRQTSAPSIGRAALPLSFKIYSPDGVEFTAPKVTLDDVNRFRDLRGASQGSWHCEVSGDSGPIDLSEQGWSSVLPGKAIVRLWLDEPVPSQSARPLVEAAVAKVGAQVFAFDLFRVGLFTARVQSRSGVTPWEGMLRLKTPDGTVAASSHNNRLEFPVTLRTLNQSRDATGQVRPWSLEVDTTTPLGVGSAVRATVIATTRIPVIIFQDRINDLIGFNGKKLKVYGENVVYVDKEDDGSEKKVRLAAARLQILDEYTAETINIRHLLDSRIKKVRQDPGVDRENVDVEPNIPYNVGTTNTSLGEALDLGVTIDVSSLKADAIKIRIGVSQHIQPRVPAVAVELDVEGQLDLNLDGFNLGSVSVNNNRIALEVGATLDPSGNVATVSWLNDDPINLNINWEAALLANVLTLGLINLGQEGLAEYVTEHLGNDFIIDTFRSTVEDAIFQTPYIMSALLGDTVTLNSIRMDNDTNEIVIDYVAPVEPDPKPNPFYTGVVGRSVTRLGPGSWKISPPSLGDTWAANNLIKKIDHIVVVMMENRAFDHVLGYRAGLPNAKGEDGLTAELIGFLKQQWNIRPLSESAIVPNRAHLKTRFPVGVGHALADVAQQLKEKLKTPAGRSINSPQGFVDDFTSRVGSSGLDKDDVLGYYTDGDLAMFRFLAENYTYCERYFSSHPGPTLPNRMYSLAGNVQYDRVGEAILDNNNADNFRVSRALSIFDLLTRKNVSWRVYESFPSITMLRFFARYAADDTNIIGIGLNAINHPGQLEKDIAVGDLKSVTFIDPAMHSAPENDDHPPFADMLSGQVFIKRIYDALRSKEALWLKTLLIITYDEHGGFYDHVIPPVADALSMSGATSPFKADMTMSYGLRVPTFVVSPWVPVGKGLDITLDHCSILKTILARFCSAERPFLSDRVHASRTFESFLKEKKPRLNVPSSPALPSVFAPERPNGRRGIVTKALSRKALAKGDVELHDLMGMLARLLGR